MIYTCTCMHVLIAISLTVTIAKCNLNVAPQNVAVIAGELMAMECRIHHEAVVREWTRIKSSRGETNKLHSEIDRIFSNWDTEPRSTHLAEFLVDIDQYGSTTLYLNFTKLEDAGLYVCVVESGHELIRWSAHLIVIELTPFCNTNLNTSIGESLKGGIRIWMCCMVRFRGYWTPSMEWRHHAEDKDGHVVTSDEVVDKENVVITSTISVILNSSINGSFFSCKIYFSTQKPRLRANATNAPNFSYMWKSPEIIQRDSDSAFIARQKITSKHTYSDAKSDHTYNVLLGLLITTCAFVLMMIVILLLRFGKNVKTSGAVACSTAPSTLTLRDMETSISGKRLESTPSNGALSDEDLPVYSVVRKDRKLAEGTVGIACKIISSHITENINQISEYDAAYAEIGETEGLKTKKEMWPPLSSMMHCQSTYASIDHTEDIPKP